MERITVSGQVVARSVSRGSNGGIESVEIKLNELSYSIPRGPIMLMWQKPDTPCEHVVWGGEGKWWYPAEGYADPTFMCLSVKFCPECGVKCEGYDDVPTT